MCSLIQSYWDMNKRCQCPMCNETFNTRPHLRVNTLLSEMVAQFKCEKPPACSLNLA
uniref:Uncharacterized protein n=1 Tax=Neolamprologus brichardi TaxID=32507 RepID=A0A3Q4GLV0_NEOBR